MGRRGIVFWSGFHCSPRSRIQWKTQRVGLEAFSLHSFWTNVFSSWRLLLYSSLLGWRESLLNVFCHLLLFMESEVGLSSKDKEFFVDSESLWTSCCGFAPCEAPYRTSYPSLVGDREVAGYPFRYWGIGLQLRLMKGTVSALTELPA